MALHSRDAVTVSAVVAKSPVTPGLRPHGARAASKKNSERHGARSGVSYSAVGAPWHRHWTPRGRLGRRATARTLNMLKVRAVARRCEMRVVGTP